MRQPRLDGLTSFNSRLVRLKERHFDRNAVYIVAVSIPDWFD